MNRCSPPLRPVAIGCLAGLACHLTGCASGLYPVQGTVVFDDGQAARELAGGFVTFQSLESDVSSQGAIQGDGSFALSTQAENDGALPGRYRVLVTPPARHTSERAPPAIIDRRYADPATSDLEATIEPKTNRVHLRIRRARK
jgi:hypothetical protein